MLVALTTAASAQRRLTGRVESTTGEPLPGASVNVVGTLVGTTTATDGRFVLYLPTAAAVQLSVRRLGYRRMTVDVAPTQN
jgi:outer membrane receptor for ferrienterochelin and colicins